jgi:CO/xanthine dehydrogenase FAD-binding subunit
MNATKEFVAPRTLEEVIQIAAQAGATILAGGTDLLPRWSKGMVQPPDAVVDLKRVEGLRGVTRGNGEVRIGACTVMSELADNAIIRATTPVLAEAAGRIACPQIRNRATVGGNLCNASPAADTAVPLLLLDAVLELACLGENGTTLRDVPIAEFFRGPGATVLLPGEILTQVRFRVPAEGLFTAWDKLGTRPAMEIAVASVGVALALEKDAVSHARVGYGSVAPVPLRGRRAEAELVGHPLSSSVMERCTAAAREEISPITDVRAGEAYRREVVGVMLMRMLERARAA